MDLESNTYSDEKKMEPASNTDSDEKMKTEPASNTDSDEKMKTEPESNSDSDEKMKMDPESNTDSDEKKTDPESNTDSEEKKDTVTELKTAEAVAKEKGKGKKPIKVGKKTVTEMDVITRQAKGLSLEVPRGTVVKSSYSLRSGKKGMDVDVAPTKAGRKRKGKEKSDAADVFRGVERDTEEVCKKFKGNEDDDEPDMDGSGATAKPTATSSSPRNLTVK